MKPTSGRSIIWSFNYAIEGIVWTLRSQRNMRIHAAFAVLATVVALLLGIDGVRLAAIIFAIGFVFIGELFNTAIEAAVDVATDSYDPRAKIAKDVAAGAVLVASIIALIIAYLVMFEPLRAVFQRGLMATRFATPDLTIIALGLVLLAVIILKAVSRTGTWMQGGWPSGHSALAFGAATIVGFTTMSAGALLVAYFIAFMVAQSRVEAEIHTVWQALVGATVGIVIVALVFQIFFR